MSADATTALQDGDTEIVCSDCKQPFVFTAGEAEFFRSTFGDDFHPPKRCKTCRDKRKPGKIQDFKDAQQPRPASGDKPKRQRTK